MKGEPEQALAKDIATCIAALLDQRAVGASICPSEAARAVAEERAQNWGVLMGPTREVAVRMAIAGAIEITRKGALLDPHDIGRGPIRLQRPR